MVPSCTADIIWRRRLWSGDWKVDPGYIESRPYGVPLNNEQRSDVRWEIDYKNWFGKKRKWVIVDCWECCRLPIPPRLKPVAIIKFWIYCWMWDVSSLLSPVRSHRMHSRQDRLPLCLSVGFGTIFAAVNFTFIILARLSQWPCNSQHSFNFLHASKPVIANTCRHVWEYVSVGVKCFDISLFKMRIILVTDVKEHSCIA